MTNEASGRETRFVQTKPLRVGVVGTADGTAVHIPGLRQVPHVELVAVAPVDGDSPSGIAARYQVPSYYDDYRVMFRRARLDAVTIAAPADLHHSLVIAAVESGLHILCDSPMARSAAEARDMHRVARDAQVQGSIVFPSRFIPARMRVKQLMDGGYIGDLQSISVTAFRSPYVRRRSMMPLQPNFSLVQQLGYDYVDTLRWWFGDVHAVSGARTAPALANVEARQADSNFSILLQFGSGAVGAIHACSTSPVDLGDEMVAVGTDGMIALRNDGKIFGTKRDQQAISELKIPDELTFDLPKTVDPRVGPFTQLAFDWADGILNGHSRAPTFEDGMKVQEIVDGAIKSQELARWVDTSGKKWPV
jgi:predicted dehydrogenase